MLTWAQILTHGGTAAIVLALDRIHASTVGPYAITGSPRLAWTLTYVVIVSFVAYGLGLPDDVPRSKRLSVAMTTVAVAAAAFSLTQFVVGSALLPRLVVIASSLALVPWFTGCSALASGARARRAMTERVLAVMSEREAAALGRDLSRSSRPATLVEVLSPEQVAAHRGDASFLAAAVAGSHATLILLDGSALRDDAVIRQAAALHANGIRVRSVSAFYEEWIGKVPLHDLESASLLFDVGGLHDGSYTRLKAAMDKVLGVLGLLVLAAVTPLVVLGNLVANRGPLFYKQPRVGANGAQFELYKFRTMAPSSTGGSWTLEADPRITPFGRWMRRTHLDELPQVLNILRGQLTTIGPRPEQPHYVATLKTSSSCYDFRHLVRPGLTGWAQVNYHYGSTELDALEKLEYELYYLSHQCLTLDLKILARTVRAVMTRGGR